MGLRIQTHTFLKIANGAKITAVVFKKEVDDVD
jgi:hypothetical protein